MLKLPSIHPSTCHVCEGWGLHLERERESHSKKTPYYYITNGGQINRVNVLLNPPSALKSYTVSLLKSLRGSPAKSSTSTSLGINLFTTDELVFGVIEKPLADHSLAVHI